MSQQKVDQYRESKKNRKEEIAKQKRMAKIRRIAVWAVLALVIVGLVTGIVITVINQQKKNAENEANLYAESQFLLQDFADIEGTATEAETTAAPEDETAAPEEEEVQETNE